jgi:AmmeMemoRadiSam system protein A
MRPLDADEKRFLLHLARESIERAVNGQPLPRLDLNALSSELKAPGATFVTLTENGELRGCIGALQAYQPLAADVTEHAVASALEDYRFPSVSPAEVPLLHIEVSRLTEPQPLEYGNAEELLAKLRPGVDGVILQEGPRRATFLPQVWDELPEKERFLSQLCMKMGAPPDLWRRKKLGVLVYQVEEFEEART